jgi:hypothetical protein
MLNCQKMQVYRILAIKCRVKYKIFKRPPKKRGEKNLLHHHQAHSIQSYIATHDSRLSHTAMRDIKIELVCPWEEARGVL